MTTNEWRTDRPDVGRFIRQSCGSLLHVGCEAHADHIASDAMTHPAHLAWQYVDAHLGLTVAAWLAAVLVPMATIDVCPGCGGYGWAWPGAPDDYSCDECLGEGWIWRSAA